MREALFILFVIFLLFALTAIKYRRHIAAFIRFWRLIRAAPRPGGTSGQQIRKEKDMGQLVNCTKCGKWVPESTALQIGSAGYFCSTGCLEKAAKNA